MNDRRRPRCLCLVWCHASLATFLLECTISRLTTHSHTTSINNIYVHYRSTKLMSILRAYFISLPLSCERNVSITRPTFFRLQLNTYLTERRTLKNRSFLATGSHSARALLHPGLIGPGSRRRARSNSCTGSDHHPGSRLRTGAFASWSHRARALSPSGLVGAGCFGIRAS